MIYRFDLKGDSKPLLLVALGNVGEEYINTRHNSGFLFVDYFLELIKSKGYEFLKQEHRHYIKYFIPDLDLFIIKPKTLMNLSGLAVKRFLNYSLNIEGMIVVHDDLDLKVGEYKFQYGKGPKSHNGINSIVEELKSTNFYRIRIGIENRKGIPIPGLDYVLYDFSPEEKEQLIMVFDLIIKKHFII
jgi:PTH1 family peptidyl-tRNA hydrolase